MDNELTGLVTDKRKSNGCVKKREITLGKLAGKIHAKCIMRWYL
jgi:hypothetical protein